MILEIVSADRIYNIGAANIVHKNHRAGRDFYRFDYIYDNKTPLFRCIPGFGSEEDIILEF